MLTCSKIRYVTHVDYISWPYISVSIHNNANYQSIFSMNLYDYTFEMINFILNVLISRYISRKKLVYVVISYVHFYNELWCLRFFNALYYNGYISKRQHFFIKLKHLVVTLRFFFLNILYKRYRNLYFCSNCPVDLLWICNRRPGLLNDSRTPSQFRSVYYVWFKYINSMLLSTSPLLQLLTVWQCLGDTPSTHDRQYNPAKIEKKGYLWSPVNNHNTNRTDIGLSLIEVNSNLSLKRW